MNRRSRIGILLTYREIKGIENIAKRVSDREIRNFYDGNPATDGIDISIPYGSKKYSIN
jgi:hypothetical protein